MASKVSFRVAVFSRLGRGQNPRPGPHQRYLPVWWADFQRRRINSDAQRSGHMIKLIVGLVQEYGALTTDEILSLLKLLNVPDVNEQAVYRYLLCAEAVGWPKEVSKGSRTILVLTDALKDESDAAI